MLHDTLTHAQLILREAILKDSIHHLNTKLQQRPINGLDILNSVNAFYQSAWSNLLWFAGVILSIGAVILPISIQIWQKKTLKLSEDNLRSEISLTVKNAQNEIENSIKQSIVTAKKEIKTANDDSIDNAKKEIDKLIELAKTEILENVQKQIEEKISQFDLKVQDINRALMGRTLHLQAKGLENNPYGALRSFLLAIKYYSQSFDHKVGRNLLKSVSSQDAPIRKMNKTDLDNDFKSAGLTFVKVLKEIEANNKYYDFKPDIENLIEIYNNLPDNK